jgi:hypothetical protein
LLKSKAGDILGTAAPLSLMPADALQVEAVSVDDATYVANIGRTKLYQAMHPDPKYRAGLPFLPSIRIGKARRIRVATLRTWLAELEAISSEQSVE